MRDPLSDALVLVGGAVLAVFLLGYLVRAVAAGRLVPDRKTLWFGVFWLGGVTAVGTAAYVIRAMVL